MDDRTKTLHSFRVECWKKLMDNGLFEESYSQRVNACFQYLLGSDVQCFGLRDFTDRGKFVITYLCVNHSLSETSFAIMDIFRRFDRKASGFISLENFVVGIIERLNRFLYDERIIDTIVFESIPSEAVPAAFLQEILFASESNQHSYATFVSHFHAFAYLVKSKLEKLKTEDGQNNYALVDHAALKQILKDCIQQAIAELQDSFHLTSEIVRAACTEHWSGVGSANGSDTLALAGSTITPYLPFP